MKYRVRHTTEYRYTEAVNQCRNETCLLMRETPTQRCHDSQLSISPAAVDCHERTDFFGNRRTHFAVLQPHEALTVTAVSEVEIWAPAPATEAAASLAWEAVAAQLQQQRTPDNLAANPYLYPSPLVPRSSASADYMRPSLTPGRSLLAATAELMQRIYADFAYDPASTTIATPLPEVMKQRRGVCQDFAHVAIACLRSAGLAARYVSGYIETLPPPGQERLVGADASHAWFAVYLPEHGWFDFDPTNNQQLSQQHITLAWGRDFSDVSPLKGIALGGGEHQVVVSVDVARQPQVVSGQQLQQLQQQQ